ncbi:ER membrane protein complex subunit 10 [Brevipalpus obovatus]|uniref:ER membrane protein complex subunit 10 n=1 Tax=Brevipalpus obovatus TaxID=246614 RepID=UPI003D9E4685
MDLIHFIFLRMSSFIFCLLTSILLAIDAQELDNSQMSFSTNKQITIKLYHSVNSDDAYKFRGTLMLPSPKERDAVMKQDPLSSEDIQNLKTAASANGLYFLKAVAYNSQNEANTRTSTSFLTACSLLESALSDVLTVSLDHEGSMIGISSTSLTPVCSGKIVEGSAFNTTLKIVSTFPGPVPDTQSYIQRMEQEKQEKMRGDRADNRSFFAKYWMYIVPLVIFVLITSTANPEAQ